MAGTGRRIAVVVCALVAALARAGYVNFESSHVHPIDLTPSGTRLLAVNTPDSRLEVFDVQADGSLVPAAAIPVGLEPVTVVARTDDEAWVVNHLSRTVSVVDLDLGVTVRTLFVGSEPTDVAFAQGRAFVAVSAEDRIRVFALADLDEVASIELRGRDLRALAVSPDGQKVYAVVLESGNGTTVINALVTHFNQEAADASRLAAMGLRDMLCTGVAAGTPPAPYPPLPIGITRNPALPNPPLGLPPKVSLIVKWDTAANRWVDEAGTSWNHCLPYRPADNDLFVVDASTLAVSEVKRLGTSLFEVSVHPSGKIYVPNTEGRNFVPAASHATQGSGRFEHPAGVRGRAVDNRLSVVDPSAGHAVTVIDLNTHIDRSTTPGPLPEREASVSQPGMLVWKTDGSKGYLTALGSRKLFRVDGSCLSGSCIFGASRATPDAVVVGEGPTGAAVREGFPSPGTDRVYVINRISQSIALVDATASGLVKVGEVPLHDPSSAATREGRRFLYDAIDGSGHGDAACSSCHVSGDRDGLSWDLGNPAGEFASYATTFDNVRFITLGEQPCTPGQPGCSAASGFDPHKGPMATQTLRGMLEPLHWRGDRSTMRAFNGAFVDLMGTTNLGTPSDPRGLSVADMNRFRDFALGMRFPPNPYRAVDDTLPDQDVLVRGMLLSGNPHQGEQEFHFSSTDGGGSCAACHNGPLTHPDHPFGAAGGKLGGVEPTEPTSLDATALFNGTLDLASPNDMEVPHTRNMHEKFGAVWAKPGPTTCGSSTPGFCDNDAGRPCTNSLHCSHPETISTIGHIHDGSIPDLYRFLAAGVFTVNTQQIRDLVAYMFYFPSGTRPAVGRQVTVAPGAPGGSPGEVLLADLIDCSDDFCGDLADADRHCELVASTIAGGRLRGYHLSVGLWVTDVAGEPALTTTQLRAGAEQPITFTCGTLDSGERLGGNRDEDVRLDGDDCAPGDAATWAPPAGIGDLSVEKGPTRLAWSDQTVTTGPSQRYDVLGGEMALLRSVGIAATGCLASGLDEATYTDPRPDPVAGDGRYYLIRAVNPCGVGDLGPGHASLEAVSCP